MSEDSESLSRYAFEHDEDAFAKLVRRRLNLVCSVALRQVGGDALPSLRANPPCLPIDRC